MPKEPRPANPRAAATTCGRWRSSDVSFQHQSATSPAVSDISFSVRARRDDRVRRTVGRRQDDAGQAAGRPLSSRSPGEILYNGDPGDRRSTSTRCASASASSRRTRSSSRARSARTCCSCNPTRPTPSASTVLRQAACDSLLARADRGLDTVIGEGGVKVSGGEKQRLSIARALLRRPHLLVFDEATSSLDSLTEEGIVETIRDVAAQRRRDHDPDRAPALDDPARRPHLRARARPHRRDRAPRRAGGAEGAVLRDVAAADWRAAGSGARWRCASRRVSQTFFPSSDFELSSPPPPAVLGPLARRGRPPVPRPARVAGPGAVARMRAIIVDPPLGFVAQRPGRSVPARHGDGSRRAPRRRQAVVPDVATLAAFEPA